MNEFSEDPLHKLVLEELEEYAANATYHFVDRYEDLPFANDSFIYNAGHSVDIQKTINSIAANDPNAIDNWMKIQKSCLAYSINNTQNNGIAYIIDVPSLVQNNLFQKNETFRNAIFTLTAQEILNTKTVMNMGDTDLMREAYPGINIDAIKGRDKKILAGARKMIGSWTGNQTEQYKQLQTAVDTLVTYTTV